MTINRTAVFNEVKDYVFITFGLMLYTFGFTVFLLPYKIVTGGIAGIGAIVFYATHFPVQYTFFLINAVLIVAALKILGWRFLMKTIYATFMLTFLARSTSSWATATTSCRSSSGACSRARPSPLCF